MKKISVLIVSTIMILSLCACNGNKKAYQSSTATDITDKQIQQMIEEAARSAGESD